MYIIKYIIMDKVRIVEMGKDIPRWKLIDKKKYWFYKAFRTKPEANDYAKSLRNDGVLVRIYKHTKQFVFNYEDRIGNPLRYSIWVYGLHG